MSESTCEEPVSDIEYDPRTETYRTYFDWEEGESISMAIVYTVAEAADISPTELDPLTEYLDPDALDALGHQAREEGATRWQFRCELYGFGVTVSDTGEVVVGRKERVL